MQIGHVFTVAEHTAMDIFGRLDTVDYTSNQDSGHLKDWMYSIVCDMMGPVCIDCWSVS